MTRPDRGKILLRSRGQSSRDDSDSDVGVHDGNRRLLIWCAAMHMVHHRSERSAGSMWFFYRRKGGNLAEEIQKEAVTLLVFQNENSAFLSVRGRAKLTQGAANIKELWKEPYKVWFPEGPDDPNIALIAFDPSEAVYWTTVARNKVQHMSATERAYFKWRNAPRARH